MAASKAKGARSQQTNLIDECLLHDYGMVASLYNIRTAASTDLFVVQ
jgi:predicted HD phosphohydrolase